jgi:hypothetical protein
MMQLPLCALILAINLRLNPGDKEELRRLGASYRKRPIHPIICRTDKTVLDGNRRVLGLRLELGEDSDHKVDCVLTDEDLRPADIIEIQLVTAIHRASLTGWEKWQGCLKLMELHPEWQQVDLANFLNVTPGSVTHMLSPSKCLPVIQEGLKDGRIALADCYTMSKVSDAEQHAMFAAKLSGASPGELRRQARRTRNSNGNGQVVKVNRIKIELAGGLTVTFSGKAISLDQAVDAAAEAGKLMKRGQEKGWTAKTIQKMSADQAKGGE